MSPGEQGRGPDSQPHNTAAPARMNRVTSAGAALVLLILGLGRAEVRAAAGGDTPVIPPRIPLVLRLELAAAKPLALKNVAYSVFPGGKRCTFTYKGARRPTTIQAFTEIGFRTTVHASPGTDAKYLRALEAAGAEIAVGGYWGARGNYGSMIGANTIQEAYDAVATSRLALTKKCAGPVGCGSVGGHFNIERFPFGRNIEGGGGFGAVFHDANYLLTNEVGQSTPYAILLGRYRSHPSVRVVVRTRFDNTMRAKRVPNEKVYYQMLAHQFLGTLRRVAKGQIIQYSLRDFKPKDVRTVKRVMGRYGRHPLIWHATEGMIASNEYAKKKVHVEGVTCDGRRADITLGLERDLFPPYLLAPLSLELPGDVGVRSARVAGIACPVNEAEGKLHVQVPLGVVLREGVTMTLERPAADMTIPDEMAVTLRIRNTSARPLEAARLEWVNSPGLNGRGGMTVTGGAGEPFSLSPGKERAVRATVRTTPGAYFGVTPINAIVRGTLGGEERLFMAGFEIAVAPLLRVNVDPYQQIPLPKGRRQHLLVSIDNRATAPGGRPMFVCHRAGPCRGEVTFDLPGGMEITPAKQPFELKANEGVRLVFKLKNTAWSPAAVRVRPVIRLAGRKEPIEYPYPGTQVVRSREVIDYRPLDEQGLLAYASWDRKEFCGFDRAVGKRGVGHGGLGSKIGVNWTPVRGGARGWCIGARSAVLADSFKNIDSRRGTILCWIRRDLAIRNENQFKADPATSWKMGVRGTNNYGETIWVAASPFQRTGGSHSGITLRRYYGWGRKNGYLEVILQCMHRQLHYCQAPYANDRLLEWRHTAVVWDLEARRLELYVDGKLAARADKGAEDWYGCPWDNGTPSRGGRAQGLQPISMDHGKMTWTLRDEFYVYNRALTAKEIAANMNRAKERE